MALERDVSSFASLSFSSPSNLSVSCNEAMSCFVLILFLSAANNCSPSCCSLNRACFFSSISAISDSENTSIAPMVSVNCRILSLTSRCRSKASLPISRKTTVPVMISRSLYLSAFGALRNSSNLPWLRTMACVNCSCERPMILMISALESLSLSVMGLNSPCSCLLTFNRILLSFPERVKPADHCER